MNEWISESEEVIGVWISSKCLVNRNIIIWYMIDENVFL